MCIYYVHACNALPLYVILCPIPLGSDPLSLKGSPGSCLPLVHLGFHTWMLGLVALLGQPWDRVGTLGRVSISFGFLTALVPLCISGLVEMDC